MSSPIKRIAVLTSGGDAPGMNAAIRAVVRTALDYEWEVVGVQDGYKGLMNKFFIPMTARSVGGIIQLGGTMLGSARSKTFMTLEGRQQALRNLNEEKIDGLIVIGGNGSQQGANALNEMGFPANGVASTIDNDLVGSDITIGVDTALNIALEAIDRLKVTATSHKRAFLVEIMGRDCGYLALMAGIAGGAEAIVIPEHETTVEEVSSIIEAAYDRGKTHAIVVVAEGAKTTCDMLIEHFEKSEKKLRFELRATKLGHVQRGGAPLAFDRLLGSRLGAAAVEALAEGKHGVLAGSLGGQTTLVPLRDIAGKVKPINETVFRLAKTLSR